MVELPALYCGSAVSCWLLASRFGDVWIPVGYADARPIGDLTLTLLEVRCITPWLVGRPGLRVTTVGRLSSTVFRGGGLWGAPALLVAGCPVLSGVQSECLR